MAVTMGHFQMTVMVGENATLESIFLKVQNQNKQILNIVDKVLNHPVAQDVDRCGVSIS